MFFGPLPSISISQHDTIDHFTLVYKQCKRQRKLKKTITLGKQPLVLCYREKLSHSLEHFSANL